MYTLVSPLSSLLFFCVCFDVWEDTFYIIRFIQSLNPNEHEMGLRSLVPSKICYQIVTCKICKGRLVFLPLTLIVLVSIMVNYL